MKSNEKVMLSTADMKEMIDIFVYSDEKHVQITIPIQYLNILQKWKEKGIDISFAELLLRANFGSYDDEIEGESTKDRRWRIFKRSMEPYYDDVEGDETDIK